MKYGIMTDDICYIRRARPCTPMTTTRMILWYRNSLLIMGWGVLLLTSVGLAVKHGTEFYVPRRLTYIELMNVIMCTPAVAIFPRPSSPPVYLFRLCGFQQ